MSDIAAPSHWDDAYAKGATTRSWYQPQATESLDFITSTGVPTSASVVDVGGGASTLVDGLLERGFADLTILDLSSEGLDIARARLGERATAISWTTADVLAWEPGRTFDVWHDRAVLHFLTDDADRHAYAAKAASLVEPGGWITIGGFDPEGPTSCSGLQVRGASSDDLAELFAPAFTPVAAESFTHVTPGGTEQSFAWLVAQRSGADHADRG